jgi:hypothetical protein
MVNLAVGFHEAAFTGCGYEVDHFFARTPWSMFPKPTTLLAARLPGLAEQLFSEYDFTWRAMEWLGGKTGNVWRTAKAKVYPMKLCKVLAAAHMQHASTLCLEGFEPLPPHLHAVLDHLTQIHDPFDVEAGGMQRVGTKLW